LDVIVRRFLEDLNLISRISLKVALCILFAFSFACRVEEPDSQNRLQSEAQVWVAESSEDHQSQATLSIPLPTIENHNYNATEKDSEFSGFENPAHERRKFTLWKSVSQSGETLISDCSARGAPPSVISQLGHEVVLRSTGGEIAKIVALLPPDCSQVDVGMNFLVKGANYCIAIKITGALPWLGAGTVEIFGSSLPTCFIVDSQSTVTLTLTPLVSFVPPPTPTPTPIPTATP
jgi:hypothetical protein